MYHWIVERRVRSLFARLSAGDLDYAASQFHPPCEHWFSGDSALGGTRSGTEAIQAWYRRLGTLLPDLEFEIRAVLVRGWPWNTTVTVEWRDRFTLPGGAPGSNAGVHVIGLRWGRAHRLAVYCDTGRLVGYLKSMSDAGIAEAAMAPITG